MLKRIVVSLLILALSCASLGACSREAPRTLEEHMEIMDGLFGPRILLEKEYQGVCVSVEDLTPNGASFRYDNRDNVSVIYTETWNLFIGTDSGYRYVEIKIRNFGFKDIAHPEPIIHSLDFKHLYKGLKPGSYRIVFPVVFPQDCGKHNPNNYIYLYTDFDISK